jgi:hypothetical protein
MPSIKIEKQTKHSPADAFKRISDLMSNDKDLKKLDASYKAEFNPQTMTGTAQGSMFKANMAVKEHSAGSTVEVVIDLGFAAGLFKGTVEKTLTKKLEEVLA